MKRSTMGPEITSEASASSSARGQFRSSREFRGAAIAVLAFASVSIVATAYAQSGDGGRAVEVATPQTLSAKIAAAVPGETLLLAPGDYGPLAIRGRTFSPRALTIQSQLEGKATFSSIGVALSKGITIKGVNVDIGAPNGVSVSGSSQIVFSNLDVHSPSNAQVAMMLRDSSDITVSDCRIHKAAFGIEFHESDHLKIYRNDFRDLQVDAIRGAASYSEVIGNHATDFHPQPGDHPDFIQFWASQANGPSTGNVIKGNIYERGSGAPVQGIFLEDNKDVSIVGNALLGTMYNGISLARVTNALVDGNFVQGYEDMGTRIITRGRSSDVMVRNNVSQATLTYNDGGAPNPGYREEHNHSIGPARIGTREALASWLTKHEAE